MATTQPARPLFPATPCVASVVEGVGCCIPPHGSADLGGGYWSLRKIVRQLQTTPRSQLVFYVNGLIHPAQQNELLSYKSRSRVGDVTRTTMSNGTSQPVPPDQLYDRIVADLQLPIVQRAFFVYISSPGPFGSYSESENHDMQKGYQQLMPISTLYLRP